MNNKKLRVFSQKTKTTVPEQIEDCKESKGRRSQTDDFIGLTVNSLT